MTVDDRFTHDNREAPEDQPQGTRSEIITGPVSDWATDFSHLEGGSQGMCTGTWATLCTGTTSASSAQGLP